MNLLKETIESIKPASADYAQMAKDHISKLTMPHWALGRILDLAVELASMTQTLDISVNKKVVFVVASDHGIAEEGVSAFPKSVTQQMVYNFVHQGAAINVLARQVGARIIVIDAGVDADLQNLDKMGQIYSAKIAFGTQNFLKGPAMSSDEARQSIINGILIAKEYSSKFDLFSTGDMGIANTTPCAAISTILTGYPVDHLVGRGTGIDDRRLEHKIKVIENALRMHSPNEKDPIDILSKVGGFEIGTIVGLILGAASSRKPIIIDGYISTTAAMIAQMFCSNAMDYVIASHLSGEKGHSIMLKFINKQPLLDLNLRLGEGTGGAIAMNIVESAVRIFKEMATFESAQVSKKLES